MKDRCLTIKDKSQGIYKEKGSKFIAFAIPVDSRDNIKEHLEQIKKEHHSARHHCYAWALGINREDYRMNDDGEPPGTAGKPIYGQMLSKNVTNTLIVVVRYFGGTKLGTGGLINAYKNSAADALNNARIITKTVMEYYRVSFDYNLMNEVMRLFKAYELQQTGQKFELDCTIDFKIRKKDAEKIFSVFDSIDKIKIEHLHTK